MKKSELKELVKKELKEFKLLGRRVKVEFTVTVPSDTYDAEIIIQLKRLAMQLHGKDLAGVEVKELHQVMKM